MIQLCRIITSIAVCTILSVNVVQAGQIGVAQGFSATASQLLTVVEQMQLPWPKSASPDDLRAQLSQRIEDWQVCRLLVEERLRSRENRLQNGNAIARTRHQVFAERLNGRLQDANDLLQSIVSQPETDQRDLEELSILLKELISAKQAPLHGSTPYRQLQLPLIAPRITPLATPAYHTSTTDYVSADLKGSPEAPITQAIYQQARSIAEAAGKQNWDPVDLYEWVKNNIRTEWYWGSMKGAEETLRQRSGNDADQAAVVKTLDGKLQLLKVGDMVDAETRILAFEDNHAILEGPGEWGPTKYIVDVSVGQMHISSMARRPLEKHYSGEGEVKPFKTQLR